MARFDFDEFAGGVAKSLISGEELKLREREQKRLEAGESRLRVQQGLEYLKTLPDVGSQDPSVGGPMLDAWLQGAASLGLDVNELSAHRSEFLSTPKAAGLFAKIAAGRGTVEDEGKLGQLNRPLLELALKQRAETREISLGGTVEQRRTEAGPGGPTERAEIAAQEAPAAGVAPGRAREIFGPTGAETGARAGAETFAKVQADWQADPERRAVELDLMRAQAEAARRGPAAAQAKAKLQNEALTAWYKIKGGQPLSANEARWGLLQESELVRFITGGDIDALEAVIAALAGKQLGGAPARAPIKPPSAPGGAAPAGKATKRFNPKTGKVEVIQE